MIVEAEDTKHCIQCGEAKPAEAFYSDRTRRDRRNPRCAECARRWALAYGAAHPDKARARATNWYESNKARAKSYQEQEHVKQRRAAYMKRWRKENRDHLRESGRRYERNRCATDPNYRLAVALRKRLCEAIKSNAKAGSAVRHLGCSIPHLKKHLEARFQPGMSWENWGRMTWHIDHIRALATFDLENPAEFRQAVHYTNLQPLWAADNLRKGKRDV